MTTLSTAAPDDDRVADAPPAQDVAASRSVGRGALRLERVAGRTAITTLRSGAPLKLLCPRRGLVAAWVYASTFGGGLVAGDTIDLDVELGPGARGVLTTQASTKVFHRQGDVGASQTLRARVADDAVLAVVPDPLVCYRAAIYEQDQTFDLDAGASLVLLDWFTGGRTQRGERWAFERYRSINRVRVDGRLVAVESLRLDRARAPIGAALRTGVMNCFATLILVGPAVEGPASALVDAIDATRIAPGDTLIASASRLEWGVVVRFAGTSTESVQRRLAEALDWLGAVVGASPWERKW